ncbi:MAG: hypothetical protein P8J33_04475 [Pirellulaceae bacterium]|nr:hypothetical protein [Pirellulaceae bacterium]
MTVWARLIKQVYEVDPLECPDCGNAMKIISFIDHGQKDVIQIILQHCGLGLGFIPTHASLRAPLVAKSPLSSTPWDFVLVAGGEFRVA